MEGAVERPIPSKINPMLAISVEEPFDDPEWLFEIKWDGYRAVAFLENGKVRLVSRTQNDLTGQFPELQGLSALVNAKTAVLDGEIVALDDEGRSSFSLMQQRTGLRRPGQRTAPQHDVPILYYVFDLIYLDGYDLHRVDLEQRKAAVAKIVTPGEVLRFSDHYPGQGKALFEVAKQKNLEGILAKRARSCYEERRSSDWRKIKITKTIECVIGGYTEPEGSRQYFGSVVLGLYNKQGQLIHVGQAGSGFNEKSLKAIWKELESRKTSQKPFHGDVEALKKAYWVKPELVAAIKFTEWTHERAQSTQKLRAPVFMGLRDDRKPEECTFDQ
ncbi:MAG TPA: non-homologous end-joining DNA ligase [Terriglobales bacterium]|nr:non-homologous end-joining DNA ligase [Terriglobales bacterium]